MANDLETGAEPSVTKLVSGIITDAQDLFKQQLALLRHEINEDFRKTKEAGFVLVLGLGIGLVGGIVLGLMLVHLLSWAAPGLPLWACYGLVGAPIVALGSVLLFAAVRQFKSINPLPDHSVQAFKENVQWIKKSK